MLSHLVTGARKCVDLGSLLGVRATRFTGRRLAGRPIPVTGP